MSWKYLAAGIFTVVVFSFTSPALADPTYTTVSSDITATTTWSGYILVNGSIAVDSGVTLTIGLEKNE